MLRSIYIYGGIYIITRIHISNNRVRKQYNNNIFLFHQAVIRNKQQSIVVKFTNTHIHNTQQTIKIQYILYTI
jgi:hypothetical protein